MTKDTRQPQLIIKLWKGWKRGREGMKQASGWQNKVVTIITIIIRVNHYQQKLGFSDGRTF